MAREMGPKGIHVAHVVIDGLVRLNEDDDSVLHPDAVAESYLNIHRQPRNAWTHELDLRPWTETF